MRRNEELFIYVSDEPKRLYVSRQESIKMKNDIIASSV